MSLRQFHIFFIMVSVVLCFGFGGWGVRSYLDQSDGTTNLVLGILAFALGMVLIGYGLKIFNKLKAL